MDEDVIHHSHITGHIKATNIVETAGMQLQKLAANAAQITDFVGLSLVNRLVKTVFPSKRMVRTQLLEDTVFDSPYGDGYWSRLLNRRVPYSAEEESFLRAIRNLDYAYIDCGANYGYMSVLVTSHQYGEKPVISIEASGSTFKLLKRNWELNNKRFEIQHNAVYSQSGKSVEISDDKHEARSIAGAQESKADNSVTTICLDELEDWYVKTKRKHLIIKLDVEGVEIDALQGAQSLLKLDPCIMFEDHGNDMAHTVATYLKNELEMRIFFSDKDGCRELFDLSEMNKIKKNPRNGYDFVAAKGDFWPDTILGLNY
jgi:FkbM family methyltransferase